MFRQAPDSVEHVFNPICMFLDRMAGFRPHTSAALLEVPEELWLVYV